jgi:hypothetical protein
MSYELKQSVRLIYADRTGVIVAAEPPAGYLVHTNDGHSWHVGADELEPLEAPAASAATQVQAESAPAEKPNPYRYEAPLQELRTPKSLDQGPGEDVYAASREPRGAPWAIVFMPLVTLAIQYGITYAAFKAGGVSVLTGTAISLLGLALTAVGMLLVYEGTRNLALTVGFFFVRSFEGFILSAVLTTAILHSLGLKGVHVQPLKPIAAPGVAAPLQVR